MVLPKTSGIQNKMAQSFGDLLGRLFLDVMISNISNQLL